MSEQIQSTSVTLSDNRNTSSQVSLQYDLSGRVALVKFAFGDRNTFTPDNVDALVNAVEMACEAGGVRTIVFVSERKSYFSDGFSLKEMFGANAAFEMTLDSPPTYNRVAQAYRKLLECPILTISFVDGLCRGAGFEWALCCDLLFATREAAFALHEIRLGIFPGLGGAGLASMRSRSQMTAFLLLTGDEVSAQSAMDAGLIDGITSDLDDLGGTILRSSAKRSVSATMRTKRMLGQVEAKIKALEDSKIPFLTSLRER